MADVATININGRNYTLGSDIDSVAVDGVLHYIACSGDEDLSGYWITNTSAPPPVDETVSSHTAEQIFESAGQTNDGLYKWSWKTDVYVSRLKMQFGNTTLVQIGDMINIGFSVQYPDDHMFEGSLALEKVDGNVGPDKTSYTVISCQYMFSLCPRLSYVNWTGSFYTSSLSYMFANSASLKYLNMPAIKKKVTDAWLNITNVFDNSVVINGSFPALRLTTPVKNTVWMETPSWLAFNDSSSSNCFENVIFANRLKLSDIPVSSNIQFQRMFNYAMFVDNVDFSGFTANVTTFNYTFSNVLRTKSIDMSGMVSTNTNAVTFINHLYNASTLTLYKSPVAKASNMESFANGCRALTEIDLSKIDISGITLSSGLNKFFDNCSALTTVNLNGWEIPSVITTSTTFMNSSLTNLATVYAIGASEHTIEILEAMKTNYSLTFEIITE